MITPRGRLALIVAAAGSRLRRANAVRIYASGGAGRQRLIAHGQVLSVSMANGFNPDDPSSILIYRRREDRLTNMVDSRTGAEDDAER